MDIRFLYPSSLYDTGGGHEGSQSVYPFSAGTFVCRENGKCSQRTVHGISGVINRAEGVYG